MAVAEDIGQQQGITAALILLYCYVEGLGFAQLHPVLGVECIRTARRIRPAAGTGVEDRVVGDVPSTDLLPSPFGAVQHLHRHHRAVLNQLLVVFVTDLRDGVGDKDSEAWNNFIDQHFTCLGRHGIPFETSGSKTPAGVSNEPLRNGPLRAEGSSVVLQDIIPWKCGFR